VVSKDFDGREINGLNVGAACSLSYSVHPKHKLGRYRSLSGAASS